VVFQSTLQSEAFHLSEMGIPRLTRDLASYTEVAVLGGKAILGDGEVDVSSVVIDGPSLVYQVYADLLRTTDGSEMAAAMIPTYGDVICGVKSVLNMLRCHGVAM
jgi:hypothetical protein